MHPYSETCVKHDRVLDTRFIILDHSILNSVLLQDCSVLAILESKTFGHSRVKLSKLLAKRGKAWYVLASRPSARHEIYNSGSLNFKFSFTARLLRFSYFRVKDLQTLSTRAVQTTRQEGKSLVCSCLKKIVPIN